MVAKIYDKTKSFKVPQFEAPVLKMYRPDGTYTIDLGPLIVVMDAADKQNLIDEWALCERLTNEWRAQGKIPDQADEAFIQFMTDGHNR